MIIMDNDYIAKKIKYPVEWDTAAYPTLASAVWELLCWERNKLHNLQNKIKKIAYP